MAGNDIGTNVTGLVALGNGFGANPRGDGVDLIGADSIDNTVGGTSAAAGNVISGNAYDGIYLDNASDDTLEFNLVGADAAQNLSNTSMGNADMGIELDNAPMITISQQRYRQQSDRRSCPVLSPDRKRLDQQQRNRPQ